LLGLIYARCAFVKREGEVEEGRSVEDERPTEGRCRRGGRARGFEDEEEVPLLMCNLSRTLDSNYDQLQANIHPP
jgi:hypothetical protein